MIPNKGMHIFGCLNGSPLWSAFLILKFSTSRANWPRHFTRMAGNISVYIYMRSISQNIFRTLIIHQWALYWPVDQPLARTRSLQSAQDNHSVRQPQHKSTGCLISHTSFRIKSVGLKSVPLGGNIPVTGKVYFRDSWALWASQEHRAEPGPQAHLCLEREVFWLTELNVAYIAQ
jgi:hypothetical protein